MISMANYIIQIGPHQTWIPENQAIPGHILHMAM